MSPGRRLPPETRPVPEVLEVLSVPSRLGNRAGLEAPAVRWHLETPSPQGNLVGRLDPSVLKTRPAPEALVAQLRRGTPWLPSLPEDRLVLWPPGNRGALVALVARSRRETPEVQGAPAARSDRSHREIQVYRQLLEALWARLVPSDRSVPGDPLVRSVQLALSGLAWMLSVSEATVELRLATGAPSKADLAPRKRSSQLFYLPHCELVAVQIQLQQMRHFHE